MLSCLGRSRKVELVVCSVSDSIRRGLFYKHDLYPEEVMSETSREYRNIDVALTSSRSLSLIKNWVGSFKGMIF